LFAKKYEGVFNLKKLFISILSVVLITACLSACGGDAAKTNTTLNITESNYLTITTDIYTNPTDYTGRTIKIEGLYMADGHGEHSHYYVYRYAPVFDPAHGHDHIQQLGFEFTYKGDMPKDNDWIEVVGVLQSRVSHGNTILAIDADSVTVLSERGAETVGNTAAAEHDREDDNEHTH